jgi:hypothetical protein
MGWFNRNVSQFQFSKRPIPIFTQYSNIPVFQRAYRYGNENLFGFANQE